MTPLVAVTMQVDLNAARGERRDALDQRWHDFLAACDASALPLPNHEASALEIVGRAAPAAIIFTGGNDLADLGGDAPERDATEHALLAWARSRGTPVMGVCRGLQFLVHAFGGTLIKVDGHAGTRHEVRSGADKLAVNSFHHWGISALPSALTPAAAATDGGIEAVAHDKEPISGVMWHPEREAPYASHDIARVRALLVARP